MKKDILKISGCKTEAEFYKKYPTEKAFAKAHPDFEPMKKKYLLGGALYGAAKAFGANDKTSNIIGALGGGAEMFFNPLSGGADVAKYGASFLNNAGVITPEAANAVGQVSSIGSKFVPSMMAYGGSRKKICAYGGDLFNEYNGPQHENGGIQISPVAETEGGENEYKGYIHSNRVKFDKNRTYADEASRIFSKYKKRLTDKLALESLEREMKALEMHQEANPEIQKGRTTLEQEYGFGGKKYAYGDIDPIKPLSYKSTRNYKGEEIPLSLPPSYYNSYGLTGPDDRVLRNPNGLFTTGPLSGESFSYPGSEGQLLENQIDPYNFDNETFKSFNPNYPNPYSQNNLPLNVNSNIPSKLNYSQNNPTSVPVNTSVSNSTKQFPWQSKISSWNPQSPQSNIQSSYAKLDSYGNPITTDFKQVFADPSQLPNNEITYSGYSPIKSRATDTRFSTPTPTLKTTAPNLGGQPQTFNSNILPDTNIPIRGALMNSIGPASQLIGTLIQGADKTQFDRVNPQLVNYNPAINIAQNSYMGARGNMRAGIVNNARSSGQLLSNMVAGDVGLGRNLSNQIGEIKMNEVNQNAGITNQANMTNAQIQMQERIANEQNKAAYRQAIYGSLTDLGNIGAGYTRDNALLDAQTLQNQRTLNMLSGLPSRYTIDANGNTITK
jgi:hypothetical protein